VYGILFVLKIAMLMVFVDRVPCSDICGGLQAGRVSRLTSEAWTRADTALERDV
jgi:hypothetical protein